MMNTPQCIFCKHLRWRGYEMVCAAFPEGVPDKIVRNEIDHLDPYPGDNGIQYESPAPGSTFDLRAAPFTNA